MKKISCIFGRHKWSYRKWIAGDTDWSKAERKDYRHGICCQKYCVKCNKIEVK